MKKILIRNACLVNEGKEFEADVLVSKGRIEKIASQISQPTDSIALDAAGQWLVPGMIDDQVHFREPGFPDKGCIATESCAAVAGGITSYMDMPNTSPSTLTRAQLMDKIQRASRDSMANYAFHFGVSANNLDEIAALDPNEVAGVKVFMGASTGDLLVDDPVILDRLFSNCPTILLAHCENTPRILSREAEWVAKFGEDIPAEEHPKIRDAEACYQSSRLAVALAKQHGTSLHVLHITTERELDLFQASGVEPHITAEVCVHHLLLDDSWYQKLGHQMKCNPAIKTRADRDALRGGVLSGRLSIIGTDHAPHTLLEKSQLYRKAPAGLPLVQHALPALFELVEEGVFSKTLLVERTSHAVAQRFSIRDRGFLREGYWADIVLMERQLHPSPVEKDPIFSRCGWNPFRHHSFQYRVATTIVSGRLAWHQGRVLEDCRGERLLFTR